MEKRCEIGFVWLHGAGLGAWIWDDVMSRLDHPHLAIELPGRGKDSSTDHQRFSLMQYVQAALDEIDRFEPERLIFVCHSVSGIIGLELASLRPERVAGFIAVGAAIPPVNGSFLSCLPPVQGMVMRVILSVAGTRPPEASIRSMCAGAGEAVTSRIVDTFTPESRRLFKDRRQAPEVPQPSLYVLTTQDQELSVPIQRRMIANLEARQVAEIPSGHLPMITHAGELANIIQAFACQTSAGSAVFPVPHPGP